MMSNRKVQCAVTGKTYTLTKEYYDNKVEEYTDEDNLKKYFITKKVKVYLNKGYSIQEIRNILNVADDTLEDPESSTMKELIDFHRVKNGALTKKIASTLNFANYKSDPDVASFINNIRNYE